MDMRNLPGNLPTDIMTLSGCHQVSLRDMVGPPEMSCLIRGLKGRCDTRNRHSEYQRKHNKNHFRSTINMCRFKLSGFFYFSHDESFQAVLCSAPMSVYIPLVGP